MLNRVSRRGAAIFLGGPFVLSIVVAAAGWSFWPLGIVTWGIAALLLAPRTGWTLAISGSLVALLAFEAVVLRIVPSFRVSLWVSQLVVWGLISGVLITLAIIRPARIVLPDRAAVGVAIAAASAPLVGGLAVAIAAIASRASIVAWSMRGDAVWTTVSAQHIGADGGIDTVAHPNASPLMSALMAVGSAPGRSALPAGMRLQSDVIRDGQLWILVILASSLMIGILAARAMSPGRPVARLVVTFVLACLPFSWYVSGFATWFGFLSASLATLLLVTVWVIWRASERSPAAAFVFLLLAGTTVLATWALLVVVPLALALVLFVMNRRSFIVAARPLRTAALAAAAVQVLAYGIVIGVPDFRINSSALGAPGDIQRNPPSVVLTVAVITVVATAAVGLAGREYRQLVGAVTAEAGMFAGLALVLVQSRGEWSYYPNKIAWLSTILLLVIAGSATLELIGTRGRYRVVATAAWVATPLAFCLAAVSSLPINRSVTSVTSLTEALSVSPSLDPLAQRLFSFSEPGRKVMLSRYASSSDDSWVNFWLLQQTSQSGAEHIRVFAYFLDATDARQVCAALRSWGAGVTVETTSGGWGARLHSTCPEAAFTVRLHQK